MLLFKLTIILYCMRYQILVVRERRGSVVCLSVIRRLCVRFPIGGMNCYLLIFLLFRSGNRAKRGVKLGHSKRDASNIWRNVTKCLNTSFLLSTQHFAGYSVKLDKSQISKLRVFYLKISIFCSIRRHFGAFFNLLLW